MKRTLKRALSVGWYPLHAAHRRLMRRAQAAVLYYHAIGASGASGSVSRERFTDQIGWLASRHEVIPLARILAGASGAALVFDDAYRSVLIEADPVLRRYRFPYTVAVPTGSVGTRADWETGLDGETSQIMSWDELAGLSENAVFASHTVTHRPVWMLDEGELVEELSQSRSQLRERFGSRALNVVVWPYGRGGATASAIARDLAYEASLAGGWQTAPRPGGYERRRTLVEHEDTLFDFRLKVGGGWDWLDLVRRFRGR